jgi:hypothetical protein
MGALEVAGPLLGVVLGGVLTGITAFLRNRKERKRVIALALSDLLEVRHRMVAVELILKKISAVADIQIEQLPQFRAMLESIAPQDPGLDGRYDAAVSLLAGIDPILAFKMRSRNTLPKMFETLRTLATMHDVDPRAFANLEIFLRTAASPQLNVAVVQLARSHSIFTARQVKQLIKKSESIPTVANELFEQFSRTIPQPSQ